MIKQLIMSATMAVACTAGAMAQVATFDYFKYEGKELRFNKPIDLRNQYFNPVVSGYYPDPSICRVGDTYYLVNSTFSYFPGVPIFKSNDLVNWQQIGHVLDRPSQVNLNGQDLNLGIYAPQISYNPKNKTYYMTQTGVGFYLGVADGSAFNVGSTGKKYNKAYLTLPKSAGASIRLFGDDDDMAIGIKAVEGKAQQAVRHNLAGRRVDASYKGIVIVGGKKVMSK